MIDYDVAVVGGGPAGATAGRRLALTGARVLVLEKASLGRDKPCGGGLTPRAWNALEVDASAVVCAAPTLADVRHGSSRALVPLRTSLHMVRRRQFDRLLLQAAETAGASVHTNEPVTELERSASGGTTLRTSRGTYRCGYLLLATGGEGHLRSAAGFAAPKLRMAVAIEVEAPASARELNQSAAVFDYRVRQGYAWAFPKGSHWNVGVGSADPAAGPTLRSSLRQFIDSFGIEFESADVMSLARGRRIPMWQGVSRLTAKGAALLGDAAGLVDPFFGEGLTGAILSGRYAADAVSVAMSNGCADLAAYDDCVRRELVPHLRNMHLMESFVYRYPKLSIRSLRRSTPLSRLALRIGLGGLSDCQPPTSEHRAAKYATHT